MEPRFDRNLSKLLDSAERAGLDAIVLSGKANIVYATGVREPSGVLVAGRDCGSFMLVSLLDYDRFSRLSPPWLSVKAFYRGGEQGLEPPIPRGDLLEGGLVEAVRRVLGSCGARRVGVDLDWAPRQLAAGLESMEGVEVSDFSGEVRRVRRVKEDWEVELVAEAARLAEEALRAVIDSLGEEASEAGLAGLVHKLVLERGGWGEAFPTIVAFHENTAYPHHAPTTRKLGASGPVLVDLGAVWAGYHSDMTRSLWWGPGGGEYRRLVEAVAEAQGEALDAVAPGARAADVDGAARRRLAREGLARYFIHGLGHGVGVEIHEEPYLRPGSRDELEPGNIVTVEPGVYMAGLHGVRVEDLVLVTGRGRRVLTSFSRLIL